MYTNVEIDMLSGPIVAMVWQGHDVVKTGRSKFPLRLHLVSKIADR